jgi:hypothetical protein
MDDIFAAHEARQSLPRVDLPTTLPPYMHQQPSALPRPAAEGLFPEQAKKKIVARRQALRR